MLAIDTTATQWVFVAFCFIFFDVFSWGILPVSWMYASEIMPLRTRNKGVALGVSTHWLSNFVVVYVTPQAIENLGYKLYIIWAVFNASFVPITWLFYPEVSLPFFLFSSMPLLGLRSCQLVYHPLTH